MDEAKVQSDSGILSQDAKTGGNHSNDRREIFQGRMRTGQNLNRARTLFREETTGRGRKNLNSRLKTEHQD
jgi:hypothetical protein